MYLNYLSRAQWKYFRHLLQMRHMRLLVKKHTNLTAGPALQGVSLPVFTTEGPLQRRHYSFDSEDPLDATIPESSSNLDPLHKRLAEAPTIDSVLDVMINNDMQPTHIVEGISVLWQHYQALDQTGRNDLTEHLLQSILPLLEPHISQLDIDELSRTYLYLRKMHIPNCEPAVEAVLMRALLLVNNQVDKESVPLTALSRLSVGINLERDFFTPLVCRNFVHYLEKHIAQCRSEEQVRLLSTCLFQLHMIVDEELLNSFKMKVIQLIDQNVLSHETPKALLKVIHMLNIPVWSQEHTHLIRKIMLVLQPCIPQLDPGDLKSVCRTFLHHQEPAELARPLKECSEKLLKEEASADALSCVVPFATPLERDKYTQRFRELLHSEDAWLLPNASGHFFSVLRALKIADLKFCNTYWSGVVRELDSCAEEQTHLRFLRHCQRYMNFNNNLGGTYRHFEVEKKLSHMCMSAMEEDVSGRLPTKFARLASFVLAYGHTPFSWKKFPNVLLSKLLAMAPQLDINECFLLSRGMQIACELRFRQHLPSLAGMQLATMDNVLISCAERHLATADEEPLSASDLSMIVRTLSHRKCKCEPSLKSSLKYLFLTFLSAALKNTVVYNKSLSLYKSLPCKDLSSRIVRDMAYNFNASQFLVPELLESMFRYISEQHKHVTGDTVEKVLTCSYNLGYTPTSLEVLDHATEVLLR